MIMKLVRVASGLAGFLAVALGAFGAHALEGRLTIGEEKLWDTATLYLLVHAVAAMAASTGAGAARAAAALFLTGCAVFSGSLYALALGGPGWLGAVTPVGGGAFLLGWILVAVGGVRGQ